ncbi:unnamed protein product [Eruca vesicaria subsp. sativa]|uniref:Uncharacterized protein n=1 Tax=Eruca vesicaria subsp. sativa TaxID=29727 RepID=A0ABC8J684_ERUVS|nr:unnamed protein product [Eruca vesicaria subsp. sativa]
MISSGFIGGEFHGVQDIKTLSLFSNISGQILTSLVMSPPKILDKFVHFLKDDLKKKDDELTTEKTSLLRKYLESLLMQKLIIKDYDP